MTYEVLMEKKFNSEVRSETAYGVRADYGMQPNVMRLVRDGNALCIEWYVGNEDEPIDSVEIGITTVGKKVIEYDGVFELPIEAVALLKEYGLETDEVE